MSCEQSGSPGSVEFPGDGHILACAEAILGMLQSVEEIRSDNGTNFVGVVNELREALKEMDCDSIKEQMSKRGINWSFNPPAASHMGGSWERQIRTTRKVLAGLLQEYGCHLDEGGCNQLEAADDGYR